MGAFAVPRATDELTAGWLTAALRGSGVLRHGRVLSVSVSPFAEGVGLMSQVARIDVVFDDGSIPTLPNRFVVKLAAAAGLNRAMAIDYGLYEREVRFYRELAPTAGIRTPQMFVARHDPDSGEMILVLEDLSPDDATPGRTAISDDDVRSLVRSLAAFHATWWSTSGRRPPSWIPILDGPVWAAHQSMFRSAWESFARTEEGASRTRFRSFGRTLVDNIPALQRRLSTPPRTLVHFDLRRSNVIITRREGGRSEFALVDWQPFTIARGPYDLALFLSQSIPSEQRRTVESEALGAYHDALRVAGVGGYSIEALWRDYRLSVGYTANYAVGTTLVDLANSAGREFADQVVERAATAVDDLDVEAAVRAAAQEN